MAYINVTVYDSTENKRVPAELPDDAPCNKIVAVLVQKLQLPANGPDGAPFSYKFHHKNSGRQIQDGSDPGRCRRSVMATFCAYSQRSRPGNPCRLRQYASTPATERIATADCA